MARIIVLADSPQGQAGTMLYQERVSTPILTNAHDSAQLLERLTWAVSDAEQAESEDEGTSVRGDSGRRRAG